MKEKQILLEVNWQSKVKKKVGVIIRKSPDLLNNNLNLFLLILILYFLYTKGPSKGLKSLLKKFLGDPTYFEVIYYKLFVPKSVRVKKFDLKEFGIDKDIPIYYEYDEEEEPPLIPFTNNLKNQNKLKMVVPMDTQKIFKKSYNENIKKTGYNKKLQ